MQSCNREIQSSWRLIEREREYTKKKQVQLLGNKRGRKEDKKKTVSQRQQGSKAQGDNNVCRHCVQSELSLKSQEQIRGEQKPLDRLNIELYVQRHHLSDEEISRSTETVTKIQEIQLKFCLKQHQASSYQNIPQAFNRRKCSGPINLMQDIVYPCVGYEAFLINSICSVRRSAQCAITTNTHSLLTLHQTPSDTSFNSEKLQTVPEPRTERLEKLRDMREQTFSMR